ncbi:hypothetical protein K2173_018675 [Erythroxylum novogranatense]|uniref:GPI transamidase component PIG-S n=1 Tax=Erythroxylum novogranatense TaxID=1862640 RepID=A0AAV8SAG9_9ROSI|nr:hypothetical protein K2173_018675 [Erythroxylum novogranatense]
MAEISSDPSNPGQNVSDVLNTPHTDFDFDPKTMRNTKPGSKRLKLTLCVLFSFLLSFPMLWKSVEIYRSPLPFREIQTLSDHIQSNPVLFPFHFQAIFILSNPNNHFNPDLLRSKLFSQITKLTSPTPKCGSCTANFTLTVAVEAGHSACRLHSFGEPLPCLYKCGGGIGQINFDSDDDEAVDEALESVLGNACSSFGGKVYSVVVVVNEEKGVKAVVGKHRHAWIVGRDALETAEEVAAEVLVKLFANGGREEGLIPSEFMPVGADGKIVLSFSLLNSNPGDWIYDWDFELVDENLLAPVLEALAPIANISVESQVLYHTPKAAFSSWDENLHSHIFDAGYLPFFVNSNEWHLDTSVAAGGRSKILQFVVYVPSRNECPLLLRLPDGDVSTTNGFISPMWGGVMVWNPKSCLKDSEYNLPGRHMLSTEDLHKIFEVFMGQFRQLFGLKSNSLYVGASSTYNLLASESGFTEWELDFLSRQHTCFSLHSSATTLSSLSRLVQSLPRMIIMDDIGKQVKLSLEAEKSAHTNASIGAYGASAVCSRQARSLAEDAFYHPSIMSVSYFSFEHCFAVYSPFFLPVGMHVLLAALREWRRSKKENAKYALWSSQVKAASSST